MMKSNGSIICQSTTITASLQVYGSHLAAGIEIWVHVGKIESFNNTQPGGVLSFMCLSILRVVTN